MKLLFKQRLFSWLDSYDIYDEYGNTVFTVEGKLSWGHKLEISDDHGRYVGTVKEELLSFLPRFAIYEGETYAGQIKKEFTFLKPVFHLDYRGWTIEGDWLEWEYDIINEDGRLVAHLSKDVFHLTDTYILDIQNPEDMLHVLMIALAIDAAKCSSNS